MSKRFLVVEFHFVPVKVIFGHPATSQTLWLQLNFNKQKNNSSEAAAHKIVLKQRASGCLMTVKDHQSHLNYTNL